MHILYPLVLILLILAACSPNQEEAVVTAPQSLETSQPQNEQQAEGEGLATPPASKAFDLSMPESFSQEEEDQSGTTRSTNFDASDLFEEEKGSPVSVSVMPTLKPGEEQGSLPEVDGGSVAVEVKTK
jgi:hypothetical protein